MWITFSAIRPLLVFISRPDKLRQDRRRTHSHQWSVLHTQSWFWKKKRDCQTCQRCHFHGLHLYSMLHLWEASFNCSSLLSRPITRCELQTSKNSKKLKKTQSSLFSKYKNIRGHSFAKHLNIRAHCFARSLVIWPEPQPTSTTSLGSPGRVVLENLYITFTLTFPWFWDILYFHFLSLLQTWQML